MNVFCIYMHKNKINGKMYIGKTNDIARRFKAKGKMYKTSPYFYSAIEKYGWDNFDHIVLKDGLTAEEAVIEEKYYIKLYNSQDREKGYNILEGGNGLGDYYQNPTNRQKQSQRLKKIWKEHPETMHNIGDWIKEHPEQRIAHSQFMKKNYNESHLKQVNEKRKRRVKCVETGEIFESLMEACRAKNISCGNLSRVLSGKGKTAGGFHWEAV